MIVSRCCWWSPWVWSGPQLALTSDNIATRSSFLKRTDCQLVAHDFCKRPRMIEANAMQVPGTVSVLEMNCTSEIHQCSIFLEKNLESSVHNKFRLKHFAEDVVWCQSLYSKPRLSIAFSIYFCLHFGMKYSLKFREYSLALKSMSCPPMTSDLTSCLFKNTQILQKLWLSYPHLSCWKPRGE